VEWTHRYAHWFDSATAMILAREYLRAIGEPYQVLTDEADDGGIAPYVIVTNYTWESQR